LYEIVQRYFNGKTISFRRIRLNRHAAMEKHAPSIMIERSRRRLCNQMASIITANGQRINCMVRDISRHGALMLVATVDDVPAKFTLDSPSMKRRARVVWWGRCRVGVVFD
jgi:hypothetical protein